MPKLTRRQLLHLAAQTGLAAPTVARHQPARTTRASDIRQTAADETPVVDVAIIGGGVSGAYLAWRLLSPDAERSPVVHRLRAASGGSHLRVALFEQSERIGGRLWSVTPPGMPHLRAELGGMRFKSNQPLVTNLARELGLEVVPFPPRGQNNLAYLRGHRYWPSVDPASAPYALPDRFQGLDPYAVVLAAIEHFVPDAATLDAAGWEQVRREATYDGAPLSSLGFWYTMNLVLDPESYAYVRDTAGFSDFTLNVNAAELMYAWAGDLAARPTYHTLRDGYDTLPRELAARAETAGASINLGHRLRSLKKGKADVGAEATIELVFEVGDETEPVRYLAHHVVLALPRRAIELLDDDSLIFADPSFRALLETVRPVPAAKAFLGYEEPWWRALGITSGRSVTDLPIRQVHYFGTEGEQPGADPANLHSLLMATYDDEANAAYWAGFLRQASGSRGSAPYEREGVGPVPTETALPERAVEELQRQLALIHGPSVAIGDPTMALFADWGRDPYGGGWHFWQIGAQPWDVVPRLREPIAGVNLSICGEAYSSNQGWVNGALHTAEQLLQQRFTLPWPESWLPTDTRLGP